MPRNDGTKEFKTLYKKMVLELFLEKCKSQQAIS